MQECILTSKGISGQEFVAIGIREWEYPPGNAVGWDLNGYTWYNTDMDWNASEADHQKTSYDNTWEHWNTHPMVPLIDDTMTYWFFTNRQRIIVVAKVSSQYEQCYMGFGRRFGNPSDYHYPLMIHGAYHGNVAYTSQGTNHFGLHESNYANGCYTIMGVKPGGIWFGHASGWESSQVSIEPRGRWQNDGTIGPTASGRLLMLPCYVTQPLEDSCYMDLEGVHMVVGTGIQAEDTIVHNGIKSIIFPSIWRTQFFDNVGVEIGTTTTTTSTTTTTTV